MNTESEYIPGLCNIGPTEIKARRNFALFSAALGLVMIVFMLLCHAAKPWRLFLFIPAACFGIGFQQWYYKFCVNFGLRGVFNFGELGNTFSVEQKEHILRDKMKARRMIIVGVLFGLVLTILFYLIHAC